MNRKIIDAIGVVLLFIGMFLAFLPHVFHQKVGFVEESHTTHVVYGMILVVVALFILIYSNKLNKKKK